MQTTNSSKLKGFVKNVGSGWIALLTTSVVGFITLPLSMHYLGKELYGVSALITSFLSIFSFLSFGLPLSILRFFSLAIAKQSDSEIKKILNTSYAVLGGLGGIGAIAFFCCYPLFLSTYSISKENQAGLFFLYSVTAFNFFQTFALVPLYSLLQAKNRYDWTNYRRVFSQIIKLLVMWFGFLFLPSNLYVLAWASFSSCCYELFSLIYLAYVLFGKDIIPQFRFISLQTLKSIIPCSVLNFVNSFFFSLSIQIPLLIIGKTLGKEMVAFFVPSITVSSFCVSIMSSISSPLTPLASEDKIKNGGKNLGSWAIKLGEVLGFFGCLIITGIGCLGDVFLKLWLGQDFVWTLPILVIMVMGVVFSSIQGVNYNLALGASSIKPSAYSSVVMFIATTLGVYVGTKYFAWSILEVAICIASVRVIRNTFYLAGSYAALLHYKYLVYFWRVYFKPTALACLIIFLSFGVRKILPDYEPNCFTLVFESFVITIFYGVLGWYFVLSDEIRKRIPFLNQAPNFIRRLLALKS